MSNCQSCFDFEQNLFRKSNIKKLICKNEIKICSRPWQLSEPWFWGRNVLGSTPDSIKEPPCMGPVAFQIMRSGQSPPVRNFGEGAPAQVSSSSSAHGSK
ncbi:hypothetical protein AVEN_206314-1 [Araneus ventricosus]|uniref:Uncharacterized protein n=1 Tax=Araneus ventricosus TaxID=182803 RepID=A0A4Y2I4V9_ARAVE|nr:hypothetical protein AVEN_6495-1 [Araneus ventricosus]GBM72567.1 hypothetical protein AVEN_26903-1 [Araneus ventricosus]GBM72625.1 hypothetical protein AVEN_73273-1 [Araneus ventricosus]GBM72649.1 hypothetical protein AVEN_91922-1 [Araneus ventricosus]GBM72673.1 hypothetical protein AVEN_130595-1 [Araneus ventricosus]